MVIAGGGIIGANIAYALARRGAAVTLVERASPAAGAATATRLRGLTPRYSKRPWPYFQLNRLGIEAWRQLDRDLNGTLPLKWGGSIEWYADPARAARFRDEVQHHQAWGYPTEVVTEARLRTLEPKLSFGPVTAAGHATLEGHVDPGARHRTAARRGSAARCARRASL